MSRYSIPLFDLNFGEEEQRAVKETLKSKWISTGPRTQEFEERFAGMLGIPYSLAVANCTTALHLSMLLLGIGKGDEVIVPSLTFAATVNCVMYAGARPVFCDINSTKDLNMDLSLLPSLLSRKTKAVVVMHYGGFAGDMTKLVSFARKHKLKIVEDACHAPMSEYKGRKLGTIGDIGCFSFFSNKNISTGEGGMLVTSSEEIYRRAKLLRSHGMTTMSYDRAKGHSTSYDIAEVGYNYRMDDIRSSIGIVQLKKLKKDLGRRRVVRERYLDKLGGLRNLVIPFADRKEFVSNYIFPVVLKDSSADIRESVRSELHGRGIQTSVHYPAVHRFSAYKRFLRKLPITEYVTDNEITLPMYAGLTKQKIDYIAESLKSIIR